MKCTALSDLRFEPVAFGDLSMLERWLNAPHNREWWGVPAEELDYIRDMVEGRDSTRPFIFHVGGEPCGYIQYWFIGHHQNASWIEAHPWLGLLPQDAVGVDLSIGDPGKLSLGIGSSVLRCFADGLVRKGYDFIIIDPDPSNTRAVRAYEKAGFHAMPELLGRSGDTLIMKFEPSESKQSA